MISFTNQADLFTAGPRLLRETRWWNEDGFEQTQRRNGAAQCPQCGLWWPIIEEPCAWTCEPGARHNATEWWEGFQVCSECSLLMLEQPDGTTEVYELPCDWIEFLESVFHSLDESAKEEFGPMERHSLTRAMERVGMKRYPKVTGNPSGERASGECVCAVCGKLFYDHPLDWRVIEYGNRPALQVLCDGQRVKL